MNVLDKIKRNMRVTKIVATRSVKTAKGDTYAGFTVSWDSLQGQILRAQVCQPIRLR